MLDRPASAVPPLPVKSKLAFGIGAIATGVKDNGFAFFLLIFYSQVVGLDARLVGIAMTLSLFFDALADPIVGYWSDNLRSKWGRRHPFMYACALPIAAIYYLLWAPPVGWSQEALFWYLLTLSITIRTLVTFYETPWAALAPELTEGYEARSDLQSYRYYFGWTGGNAMSVLMFMAIFPAFVTATITNGQFNREAYALYGMIASVIIFVTIIIAAAGTHSRIKYLKPPPPKRDFTLGRVYREMAETLANRSFFALFIAGLFGGVAGGLSSALAFYVLTYFWGFSPLQIGILTLGVFLSAIIGAIMAPIVTRTIGKKHGAVIIGLVAFLGSPLPILLRLVGVLPQESTEFVFWFVFVAGTIDVGLIICFQILAASMMADLVEQAELKTGRRSEGVFVAAITFIGKVVTGFGVLIAGFLLATAGIQAGADPSQVSADAVTRLGMYYVPAITALWLAMMAAVSTYRITRHDHEENLRQLAEQRSTSV